MPAGSRSRPTLLVPTQYRNSRRSHKTHQIARCPFPRLRPLRAESRARAPRHPPRTGTMGALNTPESNTTTVMAQAQARRCSFSVRQIDLLADVNGSNTALPPCQLPTHPNHRRRALFRSKSLNPNGAGMPDKERPRESQTIESQIL
jgi:hypothetical protein